MTMQRIGGIAALACAATYIFGFALLVTVFAESGFGTNRIDAAGVVQFTVDNQAVMITWNTVIYVLNALALAVLVVGWIITQITEARILLERGTEQVEVTF